MRAHLQNANGHRRTPSHQTHTAAARPPRARAPFGPGALRSRSRRWCRRRRRRPASSRRGRRGRAGRGPQAALAVPAVRSDSRGPASGTDLSHSPGRRWPTPRILRRFESESGYPSECSHSEVTPPSVESGYPSECSHRVRALDAPALGYSLGDRRANRRRNTPSAPIPPYR